MIFQAISLVFLINHVFSEGRLMNADAVFDADEIRTCPYAYAYAGAALSTCFLDIPEMDAKSRQWGFALALPDEDGGVLEGDLISQATNCEISNGATVGNFKITKNGCAYKLELNLLSGSNARTVNVHLAETPYAVMNGQATGYFGAYTHQFEFEDRSTKNVEFEFLEACSAKHVLIHAETCGESEKMIAGTAMRSESMNMDIKPAIDIEKLNENEISACPSAFAFAGMKKSHCFLNNKDIQSSENNWGWAIDISSGEKIMGDLLSNGDGCNYMDAITIGSFEVHKEKCNVNIHLKMAHGSSVEALHVHLSEYPYAQMGTMASAFPQAYTHQFDFNENKWDPFSGNGDNLDWSRTFSGDCNAKYILFHANACGNKKRSNTNNKMMYNKKPAKIDVYEVPKPAKIVAKVVEKEEKSVEMTDKNVFNDNSFNNEPEILKEVHLCPSAYAYGGSSVSTCFTELALVDQSKKHTNGWAIDISSGEHIGGDIVAFAKECDLNKGKVVGHFFVQKSGCTVTVDVKMNDDISIQGIHLNLAEKPYALMGNNYKSVYPQAYTHAFTFNENIMTLSRTFTDQCMAKFAIMEVQSCGVENDIDDSSTTNSIIKTWNSMHVALHSAKRSFNHSYHFKNILIYILAGISCAYLLLIIKHQLNIWCIKIAKESQIGENKPLLADQRIHQNDFGVPVRSYYSV